MTDPTTAPPPTDPGAPAAPAASPAAAPAPAAEPPAAPSWLDSLDAASKSEAEAAGYKSPADVIGALRAFKPPETPDGYEVPLPEGADADYAKAMREAAHKAGVPAQYVKALAEAQNAYAAQAQAAATAAAEAAATEAAAIATRQAAELKTEWGEQHTAKIEGARRAALSFTPGKDEADKMEFLQAMESRFGYAGMMKFWASVGDHMAEGQAHGLGAPPSPPASAFYNKSNMNP